MKKLVLMLFMAGAACGTARADTTWTGGSAVREITQVYDDSAGAVDSAGHDKSVTHWKRWQLQASFGAFGKGDKIDWGVETRLSPAANSTWVDFAPGNKAGADVTPTLSQAYGSYHGMFWDTNITATVGRQKPVFVFDNIGQSLFGNPVRWDGFGWAFKHSIFGFNMAQYVQGATNKGVFGSSSYTMTDSTASDASKQSHMAVLYAFQPTVNLKFTDDISTLFAVGYYVYNNSDGGFFTNAIHAGVGIGGKNSLTAAAGEPTTVMMDNPRQLQIMADTTLPYNLRFVAEWIQNKKTNFGTSTQQFGAADRSAYALDLAYGKLKKAGDFTVSYAYTNKGIASVINTYTNIDITADNISHMFVGQYMLEDHMWFTGKVEFHKEKSGTNGFGNPDSPILQKQHRYEFIATVGF